MIMNDNILETFIGSLARIINISWATCITTHEQVRKRNCDPVHETSEI